MTLEFLGFAGDLGGVIVLANMDYLAACLSGCDKASGKKLVSFNLLKIVGFSCQKGFVDLNASFQHLGIRRHLVTCLQKQDVIQYQLFCGDGPLLPFTQYHSLALCENRKLVQGLLGTDLLDDSDHGIDHNNAHEHGILIGSYQQNHYHKCKIQKVEKCKYILPYDLLVASGIGILVGIDFSFFDSLLYLFVCKSCHRYFLHSCIFFKDFQEIPYGISCMPDAFPVYKIRADDNIRPDEFSLRVCLIFTTHLSVTK
ncbi:unknown [Ruminococcus sp. CAG:60]|nr:unknown [Ruminococcus sp. CAG:60]